MRLLRRVIAMRELPRDILIEVMEDVIEDLHGHVHRVSDLAVSMGSGLGLDDSERELMNRHPELGFAMTRNRLDPKVAEAILYHHERFDGMGYPFGLVAEEIPILSRIILVADAFDAMTSTRAYQAALPAEFAIAEIRQHAGTQFDPQVVAMFLELAAVNRLPLELTA